MDVHNFRELKVWQISIKLVKSVYISLSDFPNDEKYGLISQMKHCSISIPSNIAEGSGRGSNKDFARFLGISLSSSYELETQLIISKELNFISENVFNDLIITVHETQRMIFSLQKKMIFFPIILLSHVYYLLTLLFTHY